MQTVVALFFDQYYWIQNERCVPPSQRLLFLKMLSCGYEETIEFTTQVVLGVLFHEIGHLVIDEFNVPIFNNQEDVADSFMAWHLIHIPSDYDSYQDYEIYSKEPHRIIKAISDFQYYQTLLGYDSENEFNNHSTDKKRFDTWRDLLNEDLPLKKQSKRSEKKLLEEQFDVMLPDNSVALLNAV